MPLAALFEDAVVELGVQVSLVGLVDAYVNNGHSGVGQGWIASSARLRSCGVLGTVAMISASRP